MAAHIEAHADLTARFGPAPYCPSRAHAGTRGSDRDRSCDGEAAKSARPRSTGHGRAHPLKHVIDPAALSQTRAKSVEALLPWLYLKGISSGDFSEALAALLGPDAPGLTASTIGRLKAVCVGSNTKPGKSATFRLGATSIFAADGVYFSPRMDHDKQCVLVIIGADAMGNKDIVGMVDGYRESASKSGQELLS